MAARGVPLRCFPTSVFLSFKERCRIAEPEGPNLRINDRIRAREVRLVDPNGNQLGIKTLAEALSIARELEFDLVEVGPLAEPPVCRIFDYGKWMYEAAQRDKESRKKAASSPVKEMKYRPKVGGADGSAHPEVLWMPSRRSRRPPQAGRVVERPPPLAIKLMVLGWLAIVAAIPIGLLARTDVDMCGDPADLPSDAALYVSLAAVLLGLSSLLSTAVVARDVKWSTTLIRFPHRLTVITYFEIGAAFVTFIAVAASGIRLYC